ncbi:MAG TPA: heme-binding protein, partial [Rhodospirillales bacterium]|nr:heme-binding protein [Rhodospirillales bacterium]
QVLMRDTLANRFTLRAAEDKANAVILSGVDSSTFRANRQDIRPEINEIDGVLMMEGGVAIVAAGSIVGAVGVSGAPGGDKDELCARAGVESVQERLDFAD